jgi:hypothetical protein
MPSAYDLPEYYEPYSIEDVAKYNKLPFYLASMEAKIFPNWQIYNNLWGKMNWTPNMGTTMKGVQAQYTPIGVQDFYPNPLTSLPNKDVFETYETTEQTTLALHDFDSKQISFLPNWTDFRTNQIDFTHDDIVRQIAVRNDQFIRTVMFQKTPFLYIVGNQLAGVSSPELTDAPYIPAGTDITAAQVALSGKNQAFWAASIAKIGRPGLSLSDIDKLQMVMRDDLRAPFFENAVNTPKDNELIKGKYVIVGSFEAYQNFKWDPNLPNFRNVDWNIVIDGFRGSIFDAITWKMDAYPYRLKADGSVPAPEVYDVITKRTVVNPEYKNAPYEIAWVVAADAYKTIKVGPPPRAFASGTMGAEDFIRMNWNGEVKLTKNFLIAYQNGANVTYDTNNRGRFVKFISSVVFGCLAVNPRNAVPVLFQRGRPTGA